MSDCLPALWSRACAAFARAIAAIGAPGALAMLGALTHTLRREINGWLVPLECAARKLLLAEAALLESWSAPLRGASQTKAKSLERNAPKRGGAARSNLDPSTPETWRVQFSLAPPRDPRAVPEAQAPRIRSFTALPPPPPPPKPIPRHREPITGLQFARRLEALRRVLHNPAPHALRLRRLVTGVRRRFPEIVTRFAILAPRNRGRDSDDPRLSADACIAALDAAPALNSS